MNKPSVHPQEATPTTVPEKFPAPIRLVHSFRDAVRESVPEAKISEEAMEIESLIIAGNASFEALDHFDQLLLGIAREGKPVNAHDRWIVVLASEVWLDAAESLRDRLAKLMREGYESGSSSAFSNAMIKAQATYSEGWARKALERQALRSNQLAALAAKLTPRQEIYDEAEGLDG